MKRTGSRVARGAVAVGALLVGLGAAAVTAASRAEAQATTTGAAGGSESPVARGKYLVNAMGCNDCHTPWKIGPNGPEADESLFLSGHPASMTLPPPPAMSGPWVGSVAGSSTAWAGPWGISYTANLTPDKATGLGAWTVQQFVDAIRNGRHQGRGRPILPPMPWQAFRNLNDADLKAIFAYLQTIKPIENKVPDPVLAGAAPAGATAK